MPFNSKSDVQEAAAWLCEDHTRTYGQAVKKFGVSLHQLRGYLNYRWGSLAAARYYDLKEVESRWSHRKPLNTFEGRSSDGA